MIDPTGVFEIAGLMAEITRDGSSWRVVFGGAPPGFEPALIRVDETSFVMERGPFHGGVLAFEHPHSAQLGPIPARRLDIPYEEPPGYGLEPPEGDADTERDRAFRDLLDRTEPGGRIDWNLPYPKHEFVRWAQGLDEFVFHGSPNTAIEEFQPTRDSMELGDHGDRGNLNAVYATHDGYWAMFFAIVDRSRLRGSMRNGVFRWEDRNGHTRTTYNFSLEQESLASRPFTDGAMYLLPRDTFRRLPYYHDGPESDEWASDVPVRPAASLLLVPADFPFLDRIAGHDETEFLSMLDHFRDLISGVTAYEKSGVSGLAIRLPWNDRAEASYHRWMRLATHYMPVVHFRLEGTGSLRTLHLAGPPPYLEGVEKRLNQYLMGADS